jgi:hypothetical protein
MLSQSPPPATHHSVLSTEDSIQSSEQSKWRRKELAIGKATSKIARRMAQWAEPAIIIDDKMSKAADSQNFNNLISNEH